MKFGQVAEYNKRNIFPQYSYRKRGRETSSRPLFTFQKSFTRGKSKWSAAQFQYISIDLNMAYNKNKLFKPLDYGSRNMLHFDCLEKGLKIVSYTKSLEKVLNTKF